MAICKNGHNISLLMEGYPRIGIQTFSKIIGSGTKGICITRMHPEFVAQKYGLPTDSCHWLCGCKGKGVLSPRMLGQIVKMVKSKAMTGEAKAVFLDGLEYLLLYNDLAKVLAFLAELDETLAKNDAEMVVCIDPQTFEDRDLAKLTDAYPRCTPQEMMTTLLTLRPQQSAAAWPASAGQTT